MLKYRVAGWSIAALLAGHLAAGRVRAAGDGAPCPAREVIARSADYRALDQIVRYWRQAFPRCNFDCMNVRLVDGPRRQRRVHIPVPKELEGQYTHRFSKAFLEDRARRADPLTRGVAHDLLRIRNGVLFKREGWRVGYGGVNTVECIAYVVPDRR